MRKFTLKQGDLYLGNHEIWQLLQGISDAQNFLDKKLNQFFENRPKYREYIDLYGKIHSLDKYALLVAHSDINGKWVYLDEEKKYTLSGNFIYGGIHTGVIRTV